MGLKVMGQHNPTFSSASKAATKNLAIPFHLLAQTSSENPSLFVQFLDAKFDLEDFLFPKTWLDHRFLPAIETLKRAGGFAEICLGTDFSKEPTPLNVWKQEIRRDERNLSVQLRGFSAPAMAAGAKDGSVREAVTHADCSG